MRLKPIRQAFIMIVVCLAAQYSPVQAVRATQIRPVADDRDKSGSGIVRIKKDSEVDAIQQSAGSSNHASSEVIGGQRIGINEGLIEKFALQNAIIRALEKNMEVELARESVEIARHNLFIARGVYDRVTSADFNYRSQTIPIAARFSGGDENSSLTDSTITYNLSTSQSLERTGGLWQVSFVNSRITTTSTASTLTTQYSPSLTFTLVQPLMRNLSIDSNRRIIQLAKRQLDLSDSQFRQRVIEIINAVQNAYWDLSLTIRNEQIARDAVEVTRVQHENNKIMVEAGALAPIELRSTEAALEARKGDLLIALQNITFAENALKALLTNDPDDKLWDAQIIPTDQPQFGHYSLDVAAATRLALKNRKEIEQLGLLAEQKEIDVEFYKDQLKPQIDFIGFYTNTGLAGSPSEVVEGFGLSSTTRGLINSLNDVRRRLGLNAFTPVLPGPVTVGSSVPDRFKGGYFQGLKNLFSQDFRTAQFGVRISLPWRNSVAEGNLGRALAEARQIDVRQRQLAQAIQVEVRNGLQTLETARQRFEAARLNRLAAEAQYQGELERFQAGLSTNFFVLQRQTDLAIARAAEARALVDYNKAVANMEKVVGETLIKHNVQIQSTKMIGPEKRSILQGGN